MTLSLMEWIKISMRIALRGDVWSVDLNPTIGREQAGKRPALIVSADGFNKSQAELIVVLLITSRKKNIPLHVEVTPPEGGLNIISYIKCEDICSISKERLTEYMGTVSSEVMNRVQKILRLLLVIT